jgi:hypothetical protein
MSETEPVLDDAAAPRTLCGHIVAIVAASQQLSEALDAAAAKVAVEDYPCPEGIDPEQFDAAQLWVIDHLAVASHNIIQTTAPATTTALGWLMRAVGEQAQILPPDAYHRFYARSKEAAL